jgi:polyhydroxybutyrate depolymerase
MTYAYPSFVAIGRAVLCAALLAACAGDEQGANEPLPTVFGGDRPTTLQVPSSYDAERSYPLLLVLHGWGGTSLLNQVYLGFTGAADSRDILVVAPDGLVDRDGKPYWNASDVCCDVYGTGVDDVGYLTGLVEDISAAYSVDPDRIYVIGHSNGGFMAYRLACERADLFAAIASLAGAAAFADPATCAPSTPVSVLQIHGTADETVPYEGGASFPGAVASVERYAAYDTCAGSLTPSGTLDIEKRLEGAETTTSTASCPAGLATDLWTIEGGVHSPVLDNPLFADLVWTWLSAHPRP